jgi:hypothetical protein
MLVHRLSTGGARRHDGGETNELLAQDQRAIIESIESARGQQRPLSSSWTLPRAESYRNRTVDEAFSWDVLGDFMQPTHLRSQAFQDRHCELMEA